MDNNFDVLQMLREFKEKMGVSEEFKGRKIYLDTCFIDDDNNFMTVYFDNGDGRMVPEFLVDQKGNEEAKKLSDAVLNCILKEMYALYYPYESKPGKLCLSGNYGKNVEALIKLSFALKDVSKKMGLIYLNDEQRGQGSRGSKK